MTGIDHAGRVAGLRAAMADAAVDAVLLSIGSDLPYVLGYHAEPTERLTMAVIPADGDVVMFVPVLEVPRVNVIPGVFSVRGWGEQEDPIALVAGAVGQSAVVGIGDHTWSRFLLELQDALPGAKFTAARPLVSSLRIKKTAAEVDRLRRSGAAADRVAGRLADQQFSGRRERDIARWVGEALVEEGCDHAAFTIVASGPNAASPHHEAGDRVIEHGDTVVVDFGGRVEGYYSDTTRTFSVGEPSAEVKLAYEALRTAQDAGVASVAPGVTAESIDTATRSVLESAGYGEWFIHRTGHGIGMEVHEDPYLVAGNTTLIEPGMAFSVEPGIYIPGRFGMRIEDIVVATESGPERLNESSRDLVVVG